MIDLFSLKIDKLTLTASTRTISRSTIYNYKNKLEEICQDLFNKETYYKIDKNFSWINIRVIPTHISHWYGHNIEPCSEHELLSFLIQIKNACPQISFHISEIHLTKDRFMIEDCSLYSNKLLSKKVLKVVPIIYKNANDNRDKQRINLQFSSLKRDNIEKEITGNHIIKFYDKGSEYKKKRKTNIIKLKHCLSKEHAEIVKIISPNAYNAHYNTLDANLINILRCEITYKYSYHIAKIAPVGKVFTIDDLINLARAEQLYNYLEPFLIQS